MSWNNKTAEIIAELDQNHWINLASLVIQEIETSPCIIQLNYFKLTSNLLDYTAVLMK